METMTLSQIIGTIEQEQDQLLDLMDAYKKQGAKEEYSALHSILRVRQTEKKVHQTVFGITLTQQARALVCGDANRTIIQADSTKLE